MRNMSYALTTPQAYAQLKTVTRRLGWWTLKPDSLVQQVKKGMGLKKGEKIEKIHVIRIKEAAPELLSRLIEDPQYGRQDVIREGFPWMSPEQFVEFFCKSHKGCTPHTEVNRIAFSYTSNPIRCEACYRQEWKWSDNYAIICGFCGVAFSATITATSTLNS
jgi:hypothetical protein